jgi:uncharacterized protein YndB with AHSA1/START domain
MTVCESEPVVGDRYHDVLDMPEYGVAAWHGTYTAIDKPSQLDADEWLVMGKTKPECPPTTQTLTFEPFDGGGTFMTMTVRPPETGEDAEAVEDAEAFMAESAAGLTTSFDYIDELTTATSERVAGG